MASRILYARLLPGPGPAAEVRCGARVNANCFESEQSS